MAPLVDDSSHEILLTAETPDKLDRLIAKTYELEERLMPLYSVRVMAMSTLDFSIEAGDETEALAKMKKIIESNEREGNPSPEGHSLRDIIADFRTYTADEGPDILKLTGEAELLD